MLRDEDLSLMKGLRSEATEAFYRSDCIIAAAAAAAAAVAG